jgi:hypothetical protein
MIDPVERLGLWLLNLGLVCGGWLSLVMIVMVASRQPARRRTLARAGLLGAIGLVPLSLLPIGRGAPSVPWPFLPVAQAFPIVPGPGVTDALLRAVIFLHLVIFTTAIGASLIGSWAIRRLLRGARTPSGWMQQIYESLPFEGRHSRRPALRISARVGRPALIGGRRPTIVIPEFWDRDGGPHAADRLRLALRHELAHAEQFDPAFQRISGLVRAFWVWLPPAWWIRRQLLIDQELLADDRAARGLGSASTSYANSLVSLASGEVAERPDAPADVSRDPPPFERSTRHSPLVLRVAVLVRCPFLIEGSAPRWWRFSTWASVAFVVRLASRLTPITPEAFARGPDRLSPTAKPFHLIEARLGDEQDSITLPAALPDRFHLSTLVRAEPGTLHEARIAGYSLGSSGEPPENPELGAAGWHRIRLDVHPRGARLWIDGRPAEPTRSPTEPGPWLTIESPRGGPLVVKDLILRPGNPESEEETSPADPGCSPGGPRGSGLSGPSSRPSPP